MKNSILLFEIDFPKLHDDVQDVNTLRRLLDNFMKNAIQRNITYEEVTSSTPITASTLNRFINRKTKPYPGTLEQLRQLVLNLKKTQLQLDSTNIADVLDAFKDLSNLNSALILSQLHSQCLMFAVGLEMNLLMLEGGKAKSFGPVLQQPIDRIHIDKDSVFYSAIQRAFNGQENIVRGNFLGRSYVGCINPMRHPETNEITGCVAMMMPQPGKPTELS